MNTHSKRTERQKPTAPTKPTRAGSFRRCDPPAIASYVSRGRTQQATSRVFHSSPASSRTETEAEYRERELTGPNAGADGSATTHGMALSASIFLFGPVMLRKYKNCLFAIVFVKLAPRRARNHQGGDVWPLPHSVTAEALWLARQFSGLRTSGDS